MKKFLATLAITFAIMFFAPAVNAAEIVSTPVEASIENVETITQNKSDVEIIIIIIDDTIIIIIIS